MNAKLYVGNLPFQTTEDDLQGQFSAHGQVQNVNIIKDKFTGRSKGFGFVTMASPEDAQKAISALHGAKFGGREIVVNEARPETDRPKREYGGGGGGGDRGGHRGGGHGGGGERRRRDYA
jgi:RNA recognition motif-containing protein